MLSCALIIRSGLNPCDFVRDRLKLNAGRSTVEHGLSGCEMPNIVKSSLISCDPIILRPLLQPPPGRPSKKRKTRESVKRAYIRALKRKKSTVLKTPAQIQTGTRKAPGPSALAQLSAGAGHDKAIKCNQKDIPIVKAPRKRKSRKQECSRCGSTGHNVKRCRSYTDGRGNLMKKEDQQQENKNSIVVEIGLPGQTQLPKS